MMRSRLLFATGLFFLALTPVDAHAQAFVNFESGTVHPICVSADGSRLFVVNPQDNRLSVYDLSDASNPVLLRDIPVGLEPVSVALRSNDEAWVVNTLSDSVSVVSVSEGRVIATLHVGDEPADIAFAGSPERAFVSAAAADEVHVFDAGSRAFVGTLPVFGKDPKALAVSGSTVHVLVQRSGNGTSVVPEADAPPQPPPTGGGLPPAPQTSLIVAADDPTWSPSVIEFTLPDNDLVEIDANTLSVTRSVSLVGTINFDLAVHPTTGEVFVVNTDARNIVRYENALRGHAVDHRVTIVGPGGSPAVTPVDLNPGVDYGTLPNPAAMATALADPTSIVLDAAGGLLYVAAMGTDRVGVLDTAGTVLARIEIGNTPGATVDTHAKRGPRGLTLHPTQPRLYVFNRLSHSLSVVDTVTRTVLSERPLSYDPTDADVSLGRRFLYDAKLSGNGTQSCAACHVDGDIDGLSWDLGVTDGAMVSPPSQPPPFNQGLTDFHPMKGPMVTQSLRGLNTLDPFHWRGEKPDLASFSSGFAGILAGSELVQPDLDSFVAWLGSTAFPPNPNRNLDDTLRTTPAIANQQAGLDAFLQDVGGGLSCAACHSIGSGTNSMVIPAGVLQEAQQMKVPQLRNMYRKLGMVEGTGQGKSGFGYVHDGSLPNLGAFLAQPVFNAWPSATKDDIVEFLAAFPTGMAAAIGYQVTVDATNANDAGVLADIALLEGQANAGNVDLVVKGTLDGLPRGLVFDTATDTYLADRAGLGPYDATDLRNQALAGRSVWTLTGVPPGSGQRIGVDRDDDGALDGADGLLLSGTPEPGCAGSMLVNGNVEPRVDTPGFALVVSNAPPSTTGTLWLFPAPRKVPGGPLIRLVFETSAVFFPQTIQSDAQGFAFARYPIPDDPGLAGSSYLGVATFPDACSGTTLSNELRIVVQP